MYSVQSVGIVLEYEHKVNSEYFATLKIPEDP